MKKLKKRCVIRFGINAGSLNKNSRKLSGTKLLALVEEAEQLIEF